MHHKPQERMRRQRPTSSRRPDDKLPPEDHTKTAYRNTLDPAIVNCPIRRPFCRRLEGTLSSTDPLLVCLPSALERPPESAQPCRQ
jgi:hypothetical protein